MQRVLATALLACATTALHAATLKATLIAPADDPRLERTRTERAYFGHPGGPAEQGLKVALDESAFELEAGKAGVALDVQSADSRDAARAAAQRAEKAGAAVIVTDLDAASTLAVADAVKVPVLNVGLATDALREKDCRANLFHLLPSERMRSDALAQALVSRKWSSVLLLSGTAPEDARAQRGRAGLAEALRHQDGRARPSSCRPIRASATSPTRCC